MKLTDGLFLRCAREVLASSRASSTTSSSSTPRCMQLVQDPSHFDVILCENLYGDVVSDLCAGLVGGLGVTPGANFGERCAVFEAVHGSAPDIAGQDLANPLALLMSAVMMLNHLSSAKREPRYREIAARIRGAYDARAAARREDARPRRRRSARAEFADAVIKRL